MDNLLTPKEVAKHLGLTPLTVKRAARRGELIGIKINSRGDWRFKKEDVENYLDGLQQVHNDLNK